MKNIKRIVLAVLAIAVLLTAVLPAVAENADTQAPAANQQTARGGRGGRSGMPGQGGRMNGFRGGKGMNGGNRNPLRNGQLPAPQDGQGSDADAQSGATRLTGRRGFGGHRRGGYVYDALLKDGVISQETYDSIRNYLQEKRTMGPADSLLKDGVIDQSTYDAIRNYLQDKTADAAAPAEGADPVMDPELAQLVEQGVITQEQAEAIMAARAANPAEPGAEEDAGTEI